MAARLYIAGTGSYAAEIMSWAEAAGRAPEGLVEMQDQNRIGSAIHGVPVIGSANPPEGAVVLIGIGGDRGETWRSLDEAGWETAPPLVHPDASLADTVELADGATVGPRAVIGAHSVIGSCGLVSRGALVGHHVTIGDGATVGPGVNVGGNTAVGSSAFLGLGCVVVNALTVGRGAIVAAGAVVVRDVSEGTRVQGVPAREYM